MKAVIYARYSSTMQTEDSIAAQVRACTDYAAIKGIQIVGQYTDEAVSGKGSKTTARRQYQKMLRDCDKGIFDTILIHKFDRVARSINEHINLEAKLDAMDIELIAVAQDFGNTNEGRLVRRFMYSMSQYYIENLADETRKGHKETAMRGLHNGGMGPFGYRIVDQKYVIDELEAEYVRRMFDAAKNRTGFTALIEEMDKQGIRGRYGKPIKYTQIYEILHNIKYTGVYAYNPEKEKCRADQRSRKNAIIVEGAVPAIISKEEFEEVQKIMETRKHAGRKAGYLCSGLVYCTCGAKMHGITSTNSKGDKYPYFYCSKKCGAPSVRMEDVDNAARSYLVELLAPGNQKKIVAAMRIYDAGEVDRAKDFKTIIKQKIAEKQKQYNSLMENLKTGAFPPEVAADIAEEMKVLKAEMEALEGAEPPKDYTTDQITEWLNALKTAPDEKAIRLLIEKIEVKSKMDFSIESTLKPILGNLGADNPP